MPEVDTESAIVPDTFAEIRSRAASNCLVVRWARVLAMSAKLLLVKKQVIGSIALHLHAEITLAPRPPGSWLVDPKLTLGHGAVKRTLQRRLAQHTGLQSFLPSLDDASLRLVIAAMLSDDTSFQSETKLSE